MGHRPSDADRYILAPLDELLSAAAREAAGKAGWVCWGPHQLMESPDMDMHVFCADQAVRSLDGLTAFSALPDAPVLPVKQRRHPLRALRSALRRRQPTDRPISAPEPTVLAADPCA